MSVQARQWDFGNEVVVLITREIGGKKYRVAPTEWKLESGNL